MAADRLEFASEATAQAKADAIHSAMIARDSEYARSVTAGQTLRWAIPYQDGGNWCVNVKDRGRPALSAPDRALLKPFLATGKEDLSQ